MARGDALYARGDVDWPQDPRCQKLSLLGKWLHECMWRLAVKERRETLPPDKWKVQDVINYGGLRGQKRSSVGASLERMVELGLIRIEADGALTVIGVRSCHPRLKWKDSPYGEDGLPVRSIIESREGEGELNEYGENTQTEDLPPQDPNKAVEEVQEIIQTAISDYKPQLEHEIMPFVQNLLGYFTADDIKTAIKGAVMHYESIQRPKNKRKNFESIITRQSIPSLIKKASESKYEPLTGSDPDRMSAEEHAELMRPKTQFEVFKEIYPKLSDEDIQDLVDVENGVYDK